MQRIYLRDTQLLPLLNHELFDEAGLLAVWLALQVQREVAAGLRVSETLHDLLAAYVVPLIYWLLEEVLNHRRVQLSVQLDLNVLVWFNGIVLDAKLLIELRIINLGHIQMCLLNRDLKLGIVPGLGLIERPRSHQVQLFLIEHISEIAPIAKLALE